jgi:hypothetical protein
VYDVLLLALLGWFFPAKWLVADSASVPPGVQAQLLVRVASYDRTFRAEAGPRALVMILTKRGNAESSNTANLMSAALSREKAIAGLPFDLVTQEFTTTQALLAGGKLRRATILYLTPGFDAEVAAICSAVEKLHVRTVTGVPDYVRQCIVLGFKLGAGQPKLLINLPWARRNDIDYSSQLLKLAEVLR